MGEATIEVPAKRAVDVRYQLQISLRDAGEVVGGWWGEPKDTKAVKMAGGQIAGLIEALDQVGWEGDVGCHLTMDSDLTYIAFSRGLDYAKDNVGDDADVDDALARVRWFKDTLDSLEPERVEQLAA